MQGKCQSMQPDREVKGLSQEELQNVSGGISILTPWPHAYSGRRDDGLPADDRPGPDGIFDILK